MTIQGQLKEMLKTVAKALGDELREQVVFVGGCTTALYITDPVTLEGVRATDDVDLVVDIAGFAEWTELMERLTVTLGQSEAILLAVSSARLRAHLQRHQLLGCKADHLAQQIGIGALLNE